MSNIATPWWILNLCSTHPVFATLLFQALQVPVPAAGIPVKKDQLFRLTKTNIHRSGWRWVIVNQRHAARQHPQCGSSSECTYVALRV